MGWCLLRLSAKILAFLRLSVNFFQLRLTTKLKINFFCFKELNINKPVFFCIFKVFRYSFSEAIPIFFNRLKSSFYLVRSL